MWIQKEVKISPKKRGFHLITDEIVRQVPELSKVSVGLAHIFIKHTSASLTINENADPTVRDDFESFFSRAVPEGEPYYKHIYEGSDDLPSHIKVSLLGSSVSVPVSDGSFNMGTWQGIYLCEHSNHGGSRCLLVTIQGEVS
ncbi:YjbQ family protein [Vibrio cholerae]|uniref:secondary thiamine-phosphate synthase enzyme YjbQ n=1 Tax=Vibrio cholerae TaxID=666 RepID=UPI00157A45D3|nr:secondary thiamine-phosphate synthase enzyme YjbQ [Vibrio cholerae]EKF9638802.1 YjbQ family protein [Vibrio cholerae]ELI0358336.1 YjbQ family protein [Vibrio cholerae]CAB1261428.1 secondary thiamine-phosphate synthase enzyme [Vibrio cholerae]